MDQLKQLIREVPDFPKPGINFYDITTLLKHPDGLRGTVDALAAEFEGQKVDSVIGIEARGFIFAPALAYHLNAGFVPVRKPRKLPAECASISMILSTGRILWRFTATLSARGIASSSPTICWRRAGRPKRSLTWSKGWAVSWPVWSSSSSWNSFPDAKSWKATTCAR